MISTFVCSHKSFHILVPIMFIFGDQFRKTLSQNMCPLTPSISRWIIRCRTNVAFKTSVKYSMTLLLNCVLFPWSDIKFKGHEWRGIIFNCSLSLSGSTNWSETSSNSTPCFSNLVLSSVLTRIHHLSQCRLVHFPPLAQYCLSYSNWFYSGKRQMNLPCLAHVL